MLLTSKARPLTINGEVSVLPARPELKLLNSSVQDLKVFKPLHPSQVVHSLELLHRSVKTNLPGNKEDAR